MTKLFGLILFIAVGSIAHADKSVEVYLRTGNTILCVKGDSAEELQSKLAEKIDALGKLTGSNPKPSQPTIADRRTIILLLCATVTKT